MSAVSDTVYKHTAPIVPVKRSNVLHVINAVMSLATTKRSITPEIISLQGKSIRCTSTSEYNFFAPLRRKRANWIFGFPKLSERKSLLIVNTNSSLSDWDWLPTLKPQLYFNLFFPEVSWIVSPFGCCARNSCHAIYFLCFPWLVEHCSFFDFVIISNLSRFTWDVSVTKNPQVVWLPAVSS